MDAISNFLKNTLNSLDIKFDRKLEIDEIQNIIEKINEFLYTYNKDTGITNALDQKFNYVSEFHKFWEKNHKKIINPQIDNLNSEKVADKLHEIYLKYDGIFYELYDTCDLNKREIAKVRFFSANQDFRGSRNSKELFNLFKNKPEVFNIENIYKDPENFLAEIKSVSLAQNDKRVKYAKTSAGALLKRKISPYDLFAYFNKDIEKIRNFLKEIEGAGFGNKKTDMFLRDMIVLKVWQNPKNFEIIDVASDINTIRVALRTGILKTDIKLVSSFLDIFCHQYALIDKMNAKAWRKVWEIWKEKYPEETIEGPCLMDYIIYKIIGKEFCKDKLYIYECDEKNHTFKYKNGLLKYCKLCKKNGAKNTTHVIKRMLPCKDGDGNIVIANSKYVSGKKSVLTGMKNCPFVGICKPNRDDFLKLKPPKSISILGRTGWNSAMTKSDEGGGGLMA